MNRPRIRRFLSITAVGALMLAAIGVGPAVARTPDWFITPVRLPVTVAPGNSAGYFVTVENGGPSNINRATFSVTPTATPNATPTYFSGLTWLVGGPEVSCTTSGKLVCDLGTFEAGEKFTLTVAYLVPPGTTGTKFSTVFFMEAGTGNVGGKNQSRGDKLEVISDTNLNQSQNFDGGFVVEDNPDQSYATGGNLGRNNQQTSQADVSDVLVTVNVEDGITDELCDTDLDPLCANQIGEWTKLNVPNNSDYIKLTLNIWGGSVPGGTSADEIFLIHILDDGTLEFIGDDPIGDPSEICADANVAPSIGECIKVTKVGNNFKLVAWLSKNGNLRGGF